MEPASGRARGIRGANAPSPSDCSRSSGERLEALLELAGVALLRPGERLEPLGDLHVTLVARGLREARVHLRVLVGLAGDRRLEVLGRRTDRLSGGGVTDLRQVLEVSVRVARLTFCDR